MTRLVRAALAAIVLFLLIQLVPYAREP